MGKSLKNSALVFGLLSPLAAYFLYTLAYSLVTHFSPNPEKDWALRLAVSALAMTMPFFLTLRLAIQEGRQHPLTRASKIGLAIAFLSLGLVVTPISDGVLRTKQSRNLAMRDVPAPLFDTPDISGKLQSLSDHKGEVVLVNVWATWCEPCRKEMPKLDALYRTRKDKGFIVFGLSAESIETQRQFLQQISVSYPLLTLSGQVPNFYRDIARYPAIVLIDRLGRVQPAPSPSEPFEKVESTVDKLLTTATQSSPL
jgi:thiol-disulfide isomerase/thioredoxin